ncbi:GTPase Era [Blattabacterium cuenoti]|uniref:GTPase Era n=1 Tax=Blattabacterium cuenoti TaxID=1653831 RepID=UPI00163BAEFE|nr:GTPase Era [Blattabacterium cuenoti]
MSSSYKSGFVNIIGFPNSGKSTLINSIIGEKISIITYKPQTTRHRILGIFNQPYIQIVFSDTPGIIMHPIGLIQKIMMQYVKKSLEDADIILFTTEIGRKETIPPNINKCLFFQKKPIIILINKIDKIGIKCRENILYDTIEYWNKIFPKSEILPISALKKINEDLLINKIITFLSEHPPYYPNDIFSNKSERFFVSEIIRENIFIFYRKEIPYCTEIQTELFKEYNNFIYIRSTIYVERNSQKGILIGEKGKSIKKLEYYSVMDIESFFKKKVQLFLNVKICKNWRYDYNKLKNFGY